MTSQERSKPKTRARQKSGAKAIVEEPAGGTPQLPAHSPEPEWHERAAFHVTFDSAEDGWGNLLWQTRAYHEESDSRAMWPGAPGAAMIGWICDKAGLTGTNSPGASPADPQLLVGELHLDEVLAERQVGEPGNIKRLRAGVDFQLAGALILRTNELSRSVTQILACSPATGATTILAADQQQLRPETSAYTAELEFDVPETGDYQLLAIVLLPDDGAVGIRLGPMLSVIP